MSATALDWRKALASNSTSTSWASINVAATAPSGDGIFDLRDQANKMNIGVKVPSYFRLLPFGSDAANEDFKMRLWGWNKVLDEEIYIPALLCELTATLGSTTATALGASNFLADTIVVDEGPAEGPFGSLVSTAADLAAGYLIHLLGCRWVQFDFKRDGGLTPAASVNCLFRPID